jgi:hypothetical protein
MLLGLVRTEQELDARRLRDRAQPFERWSDRRRLA